MLKIQDGGSLDEQGDKGDQQSVQDTPSTTAESEEVIEEDDTPPLTTE